MKASNIAFAAALAVSPALAAQAYPPGLFENSPVVPNGPPDANGPAGSPDAGPAEPPDADLSAEPPEAEVPAEPPEAPLPPYADGPPPYAAGPPPYAAGPRGDYCSLIASRIFRNLEEVRRAHARCDPR